MGNKCIKQERNFSQNRKSSQVDEFFAFSQLNEKNTKSILSPDCKITDFKLLKVLGRGSFGKVMLVQHSLSKRFFAMKIIPKALLQEEKSKSNAQTERTLLEILENRFIMKLHYAFQTKYKLYLVVDYMSGGELFEYLRHYKRFSEDVCRFYAAQILIGLEYLQEKDILYRDLKPENLLLENGYLKLADFGFSRYLGKQEQAHSMCGTPEYVAPEVLSGQGYDNKCDCYSFGAVIFEMLVGLPPLLCKEQGEVLPQDIGQEAQDLIFGLLEKDPKKRLSIKQAKEMAFFRNIDFDAHVNGEATPPDIFMEQSKFKFFDQSALQLSAKDTQCDKSEEMSDFCQFSYCEVGKSIQQTSLSQTHYSSYGEPKSI